MPYLGVKPADEFTSKDLNGEQLILDADADTTITADTDDQIDIRIAGADDFQFTANTFTALSGSTVAIASGATIANSGTATGFGVSLANDTNNYVTTATGSTGLNGEANLTFDGSTLAATGNITATGTVEPAGDTAASDNAAIGYTSAEGLILTGQGSTDDITIKNDADTTVVNVATGATDVEVSAGNLLFGTASKGVYLGVTVATAANLLDDYEEGTFTATARLGGASGTDNGTATMNYTKIGKQVHVEGSVQYASSKSGSGHISISGLPFTGAESARSAWMVGGRINATLLAANASATVVNFYLMTSSTSGSLANATDSLMGTGAGKGIWISLTYFV